jgi:hypothetical protein
LEDAHIDAALIDYIAPREEVISHGSTPTAAGLYGEPTSYALSHRGSFKLLVESGC